MFTIKIERLKGFVLNPNDRIVNSIFKRLGKTEGVCPCHHEEWNENTPIEDKLCPCSTYRNGDGCHCCLYVKEESLT